MLQQQRQNENQTSRAPDWTMEDLENISAALRGADPSEMEEV